MKIYAPLIAVTLSLSTLTMLSYAQQASMAPSNPAVGGMPMMANKNIVENAVNSKDHTTLVAAIKAADLVDAL